MEDNAADAQEKLDHLLHLGHKLHDARRQEHRQRMNELGFDPVRGQGRILKLLLFHDGVVQREIAYLLNISPQSIGESLSKLEEGGFITRQPDASDRRALIVSLTPTGREVAQELDAMHRKARPNPFEGLSDNEQVQLCELFDKAIENMEERTTGLPEPEPPHPHPHQKWM